MPSFGATSKKRLAQCHLDLQRILTLAIEDGPDFAILAGHRTVEEQQELWAKGRTAPGPIVTHKDGITDLSRHNVWPSLAFDIAPYPIDWDDTSRFQVLGAYILGIASALAIPVRWGGDFNGNWDLRDERFIDLPHFELIGVGP